MGKVGPHAVNVVYVKCYIIIAFLESTKFNRPINGCIFGKLRTFFLLFISYV